MNSSQDPMRPGITIGEKYGPAMEITDPEEARSYFERCVEHTLSARDDLTRADAESLERRNLGYFAGYYGPEVMTRVQELFLTEHPVFGKIKPQGEACAVMNEADIREKIANVERVYADVLNMTAEEVSSHEHTVYWTSRRARALGLLDAYHAVLGEETDNGKYPCMAGWQEAAATAGQWPWVERA